MSAPSARGFWKIGVAKTLSTTSFAPAAWAISATAPMAVTSSLNMNFLSRPAADRDLLGVCKLIKVGRTLVVGDVSIVSDGSDAPVAHAVGTYALPRP